MWQPKLPGSHSEAARAHGPLGKIHALFVQPRQPKAFLNPNRTDALSLAGFSRTEPKSVDIYVYMRDKRRGPYQKGQLEEMWRRGKLPKDTLYWHDGMSKWAVITDLFANRSVITAHFDKPSCQYNVSLGSFPRLHISSSCPFW